MKTLAEISRHPRVTVVDSGPDGGSFLVDRTVGAGPLRVIASWMMGWDHASVSLPNRTPRYQEMKLVKRIFFRSDEWAYELHPPESDYISINDNVLHLWRPHDHIMPPPPRFMI